MHPKNLVQRQQQMKKIIGTSSTFNNKDNQHIQHSPLFQNQ